MKFIHILILICVILGGATAFFEFKYMPDLAKEFKRLETERIVISNKLTTAKIVQQNLNHVLDLITKNMDFPGKIDSVTHESHFFSFITSCINDLKLTLISVKPDRPQTKGRVTTFSYDIVVEGDFFKFGELCSKIENSRRIVSLKVFNVTLKDMMEKWGGGPENKTIKVKMRVDTYRVKKI